MGPLFFRAENAAAAAWLVEMDHASMGPLFFRAENRVAVWVPVGNQEASMGPLFFRAENKRAALRQTSPTRCFNGAALFQSGEPKA